MAARARLSAAATRRRGVSARNPREWAQALAEFDRLQDLSIDRREAALLDVQRQSPELAARVRDLFDADAQARDTQPAPQELPPRPAPRVTGYTVHGLLGRGGMGEVYAAERVGADFVQPVALKRMLVGNQGADVHERFLRERRILAQLNHPNVARLLDGGLDADGNPYFAMERVDGVPITRFVQEHRLEIDAVVRLFIVVCEAVAYAHRNLIVHRDIKPSNVLVSSEGTVKLLDFGIAKLIDTPHDTVTRSLAMTPAYAAPEQLLGEAVSTGTDVYSLGLLLFELLTGELPQRSWRDRLRDATHEDDTLERPSVEVLKKEHADARVQRRLAQSLRGDLDQIVMTALRRDPARRYLTAQAFADDLRRYLDGHPVQARADTLRYRMGKFVHRNAVAVAAMGLLMLSLVAATAVSIGFARSEAKARAEAEAQARHATRTRDFVVSLFNDINVTANADGKGKEYTAAQLLQNAADRLDRDLADAPDSQAELYAVLAAGLLELAEYKSALVFSDKAVEKLTQVHGPHNLLLADALVVRGQARQNLGDLHGTDADAHAALAALETLPQDKAAHMVRIRALTNLTTVLTFRSDFENGLRTAELILAERKAALGNDDDPALSVDYNNLATLYIRLERFPEAEAAYRRAGELLAKQAGPEHPRMVWIYNGIAYALWGQGKYTEAKTQSDHALKLGLEKLGPENQVLISVHLCHSHIYADLGDLQTAVDDTREAVRVAEKLNNPQRFAAELRYGLMLVQEDKFSDGAAMLAASMQHLHAQTGKIDSSYLFAAVGHGVAVARLGKREEGSKEAREALDRLTREFPTEKKRVAEAQAIYAGLDANAK
jgi:tetratricopeptide (TPR) repeat protein